MKLHFLVMRRDGRVGAWARTVLAVGVLLCAWGAYPAAQRDLSLEESVQKLALVVGNDAYPKSPLRNPVNDAKAMEEVLESTGFDTDVVLNADLRTLERSIDRLVGRVRTGDVVLFFYAGHGMQLNGENYLIPVDFNAKDEADAKYVSYSASRLQDRLDAAGARLVIIVLDACRNNPFSQSRAAGGGLAPMNTGRGTLIALATAPGKTADDNPSGSNGLFTGHLVQALKEPGLSLDQVFNRVRERVYTDSAQKQLPWTVSSVIGEFYFRGGAASVGDANRPQTPPTPQPAPASAGASVLDEYYSQSGVAQPAPPAAAYDSGAARAATAISLEEAENAYGRGDFPTAIARAQAALRGEERNKDALTILALSYFATEKYELFVSTGAQALQAGGGMRFGLMHHHTLSPIHEATLAFDADTLAFDPSGFTGCNQRAFQVPLSALSQARQTKNGNGEIFLGLRVRIEQNKQTTLNFASAESRVDVDKSGFLPVNVVRSPEASARRLSAIAALLQQAAGIQ